jgi:phosphoribosylanthranilate isomerase
MNQRIVKICGITTPESAVACLDAGADIIGLVHYPPSPRHVDVKHIRDIIDAVESNCSTALRIALVVVDQLPDEIDSRITYLQAYGELSASQRKRRDLPPRRIHVAKDHKTSERFFKNETPMELGLMPLYCLELSTGNMPGGNGAVWDWSIARRFCEKLPALLAGGITPENVAEVIQRANPYGIDVSSGVESALGIKDLDKVRRLIDIVRHSEGRD